MWKKLSDWWYRQISDDSKPLVRFALIFKTDCWVCQFYRGVAVGVAIILVPKFFIWVLL